MFPIALFWDFASLQTSCTIDGLSLKEVQKVLLSDSVPSTFKVYVHRVDVEGNERIMKLLEELEAIGASLVDCQRNPDGTSAISTFITVDAFSFAWENPKGSSIVIVTEGYQLSYAASVLRDRGYDVRSVKAASLLPEPSLGDVASVSESMQ